MDNVTTANEELVKAKELSQQRNKTLCKLGIFILILVTILGLSIYFMFFQ